jgi:hypothetical protein
VATVTRDDAYEFDEERGFGWLLFAATMLGLAGILSIFNGIGALSKASFYSANAHYVFSDLRTWGWITLIVGILLIVAAMGVFSGSGFARWFGIFAAGLNAFGHSVVPVLVADGLHPRHPRDLRARGLRREKDGVNLHA